MVSIPSGLLTCLREVFGFENDFTDSSRAWALWRLLAGCIAVGRRGGRAGPYHPRAWRQPERRLRHRARRRAGSPCCSSDCSAQGYGYRVVNASVSGETTGGGLQRLPRALELHKPAVVIVELGAQRRPARPAVARTSATTCEDRSTLAKAAPARGCCWSACACRRTTGRAIRNEFMRHVSRRSRRPARSPLVPFLLDGVALNAELMQADGMHPNARGAAALCSTTSGRSSSRCCRNAERGG